MNPGDEYDIVMTCGHTEKRKMTKQKLEIVHDLKIYLKTVRGVGNCVECNKRKAIGLGWSSGSCLY